MVRRLLLGAAIASGLLVSAAAPAVADGTCYTGCTPGVTVGPGTLPGGSGTTPVVPGASTGGPATTGVGPGTLSGGQTRSPVAPAEQAGSGGLPFTGADIASLCGLGLAMVGAGALLVLVRRRRAASPSSGA